MPRQIQNVGYKLRYRHDSQHGLVVLLQIGDYIQGFIQKMRKRMIRVHDLWRKDRQNLIFKILLNVLLFLCFQFLYGKPADTIRAQQLFNLRVCLVALLI